MFGFFRRKIKELRPTQHEFEIQFKVSYSLKNGTDRCTGVISISVPASNESEAKQKLEKFAVKRIGIKILQCIKKNY